MEKRNVQITLEEAREWYNSDCIALKEVALKAYNKEELDLPSYTSITSIDHVLSSSSQSDIYGANLKAVTARQLSMVKAALNKGYDLKMFEGKVWYPYFRIVPISKKWEDWGDCVCGIFECEGRRYYLVGGHADPGSHSGLALFNSYDGVAYSVSHVGLYGCATKEIAEHFGRHFGKLIFDFQYCDQIKYSWVQ